MIVEKAYAKINLALEVFDKGLDGYHDLNNIMVPVDLYDVLTFEKIEEDVILLDNTNYKAKDNIVYKAAKLFLRQYRINKGVLITLDKHIPSQAGLGGGSADAAATFRALNKLFELNRPLEELRDLSVQLGSDIAYCLYEHAALCTGRGTEVKLLNVNYPKWNVLLIKPPFGCSTADIYSNYEKLDCDRSVKLQNVIKTLEIGDLNLLKDNIFNDLEATAFKLKPELEKIKEDFNNKSLCMMSGSGSTLFLLDDNIETLTKIKDEANEYLEIYLTKLL